MAKVNGKFVPPNKIFMSDEQKQFILKNFKSMTNDEISKATGLSKTYVRMWAYNEGLQRDLKVNWTNEQTSFFLENWKHIGNTELAKLINEKFPSKKFFSKKTIEKKMTLLGLKRTMIEEANIRERNRLNGVWGPPQMNKKAVALKRVWITINPKMKVELRPNQLPGEVLEKYKHLVYK